MLDGDDGSPHWVVDQRDWMGRCVHEVFGNDVVTERDYDPRKGRVTAIRSRSATALANDVQDLGYAYSLMGNLTQREDRLGDENLIERFEYDAKEQLQWWRRVGVNETGAERALWKVGYTFDDIGNFTARQVTEGAGPAVRRLRKAWRSAMATLGRTQ